MTTAQQQQAQPARARRAESPMLHRTFGVTTRGVDPETRSVEVVASSEAVDSYDEIVEQDWDLKRYLANPAVLWNHNRTGLFSSPAPADMLPIGYATDVRTEGKQLVARLNFVDERANPLAEKVWQGFVQKSIRAVSVGFRSRTVLAEKVNGVDVYRLRDNELYEISATPIGANPEAVAKAHEEESRLVREWAAAFLAAQTNDPPHATPRGTNAPDAQAAKETDMKTIEELKAEHEKVMAAAKADQEKAQAEAKAAAERADKAEKALAEATETTLKMGADLHKAAADLEAERAARHESDKARAAAEDKLVVGEVEALSGVKFVPAQKAAMLSLARKDKAAFDAIVAQAPDLKLAHPESVLAAKANQPQATDDLRGDEFAKYVDEVSAKKGAGALDDDGPIA